MSRDEVIDQIIEDNLNSVVAEAEGDDEALLRLAVRELGYAARYRDLVEEVRDDAALRLREKGMTMTRVALLAGLSDSYLARRLFERGAERRVARETVGAPQSPVQPRPPRPRRPGFGRPGGAVRFDDEE